MAQQMGNGNEEEVQKACEYLEQTVLAASSASNHVKTQCEKLKKLVRSEANGLRSLKKIIT